MLVLCFAHARALKVLLDLLYGRVPDPFEGSNSICRTWAVAASFAAASSNSSLHRFLALACFCFSFYGMLYFLGRHVLRSIGIADVEACESAASGQGTLGSIVLLV